MSDRFDWDDFWALVGTGAAICVIALILTLLFKLVFADNTVKYCIVMHDKSEQAGPEYLINGYRTSYTVQWKLEGQVDWRSNDNMGYFKTFDEALEAAKKINCPLNIGK